MTSATDRLRALLDERGVEWRRTPHYSSESIDNETVFRNENIEWIANDHLNGYIGLRALRYQVTPEQAVEATLGRGTCEDVSGGDPCVFVCSCCGATFDHPEDERVRYCPNCGRRCVG